MQSSGTAPQQAAVTANTSHDVEESETDELTPQMCWEVRIGAMKDSNEMILQGLDIFETLATNRTGLVTVPIICMGHLKMTFSGAMGCKCLSTNQTLITGDPNGICNVLI